MAGQQETIAVRKSLTVRADLERAFAVFTGRIGGWWPLQAYSIGGATPVGAEIEPYEGGRWFERGEDGTECPWGHVRVWDPPHRVVLTWEISADWQADPDTVSEVEVRFTDAGDGRTTVELEHRGLEAYAEHAGRMRGIFDSEQGWSALLQAFAGVVEAAGGQ
jgi:uncharacterized protein YndB with AHSA1/START domain